MFQMRCNAPAQGEASSGEPRDAQETADLWHLQELFARSFERGVVEAVYDASGGSLAATSGALLAMSAECSGAGPASSPAAAESDTTSKGKYRTGLVCCEGRIAESSCSQRPPTLVPQLCKDRTLPREPAGYHSCLALMSLN